MVLPVPFFVLFERTHCLFGYPIFKTETSDVWEIFHDFARDGETVSNQVGQRGCYWSGTLYPGNDARYAYYFYFYEGNQQPARNSRRYMGYSVRPVKD